jgi:GT2 family glycosyltransferase
MTKEINLVHITVAYNSPEDLENLIQKIGTQDEKEHRIICIDNSEKNYVDINEELCRKYNSNAGYFIKYSRTKKNLGSACGFALGMQLAIDAGADWIWLHDQDGYPLSGCIQNLKKYLTDEGGIFSPNVLDENSNVVTNFHGYYDKYWDFTPAVLKDELSPTEVAGSAGLVISKNVIDSIGLYDYVKYFTGFEDYDFCLRAKEMGFRIFIINNALYCHPNKWSHITYNKRKSSFLYFGAISSIESFHKTYSSINYNITHLKFNFLINFLYSVLKVFVKKILVGEIALCVTYKYYFSALWSRYFKRHIKICIDTKSYLN